MNNPSVIPNPLIPPSIPYGDITSPPLVPPSISDEGTIPNPLDPPAERPKRLGDNIIWSAGNNGTSTGNSSSFNNINRQIKMEYDEIISGNGTQNLDSNGNQKIYQGRESKSWTGAGEYDVLKRNKDGTLVYDSKGNPIETNNRILVKRDSSGNIIKIGYVEGHNYGQIKTFPTKE